MKCDMCIEIVKILKIDTVYLEYLVDKDIIKREDVEILFDQPRITISAEDLPSRARRNLAIWHDVNVGEFTHIRVAN